MTRQCLAKRLDSILKVQQELAAWESMRNKDCGKALWHFTTPQARTKMLSLYPKFESSGVKIPRYNQHKYQVVSTLVLPDVLLQKVEG